MVDWVVATPLKAAKKVGVGMRFECLRCNDWVELVGRNGLSVPIVTGGAEAFDEQHARCKE